VRVHGIVLAEKFGTFQVDVAGADISNLTKARVDNSSSGFLWGQEMPAGYVVEARKVMSAADCQTDGDRALLDVAHGKPFVRATVVLHEKFAEAVKQKVVGWGAHGFATEKIDDHIVKCHLRGVALDLDSRGLYRVFPGEG
jgi:hypothetical protein